MPTAVVAAFKAVGVFLAKHAIIRFFVYVAASVLIGRITNRLFGPKAGVTSFAGIQTTSRGSLDYRKFGYGRAMVGGTIIFNNTRGASNEWLDFHVAFVDHEIEGVVSFQIDNATVPVADINWTPPTVNDSSLGTGDGEVSTAAFVAPGAEAALEISWYPGFSNQPADADLIAEYTELDSGHRARGVFVTRFSCKYNANTEKVWEKGAPGSLTALVDLRLVYDPRLDTTNGGTGPHRYTDDTTWEWSDNPALCIADYLMVYMDVDPVEDIDWPAVIVAADACDVVVDVPTPPATQKRFTCNGIFIADEGHENVLDNLKQSMAGRITWTGGQWVMWAGVWVAPTLSFDEGDLKGDLTGNGFVDSKERYNGVRGFYIDPARDYRPVEFFPATNAAYVTRDNGKEKDFEMDLRFVNHEYQAQRIAIRKLEQFDNQQTITQIFDAVGAKIYAGLEYDLNFPEFSWSNKAFRCIGWKPMEDGRFEITAREDYSTRYTDPLVGGYTSRTAAGVIVPPVLTVPAATNLATVGQAGIIQLSWDNPPSSLYEWIEVHVSTTDNVATATKLTELRGNTHVHVVGDTTTRYYWTKARGVGEQYSAFQPVTTAGVAGVATSSNIAEWKYIKPTNGTAIQNSSGTLTIEARGVSAGVDALLAAGTIKLYEGSTEITVGNGYAAGSDGYTGVFDSGDISGNVVVELKDGPAGDVLDTITLVDVTDGTPGGDGEGAVYGYIVPSNTLAWTRATNSGAWSPASLTTDLDCTFVKDGVEVARIARRITLASSTGFLSSSVVAHPGLDLNTSRVTVSVSGTGTTAFQVEYSYTFGGQTTVISETVASAQGGTDGTDGDLSLVANYTNHSHAVPVTNLGVEDWAGSGGLGHAYEGADLLQFNTNTQTAAFPAAVGTYNINITKVSGDTLTEPAMTGASTSQATIAAWAGNLTQVTVYRINYFMRSTLNITGLFAIDITFTPGDQGADGVSPIVSSLTNPVSVVASQYDGLGYSLTASGGTHEVVEGATDKTSSATHTVVGGSGSPHSKTQNGLTLQVTSAGVYSLSGAAWTTDEETFTLRAVYSSVTMDKTYTISKNKATTRVLVIGGQILDLNFGASAGVGYRFDKDGDIYKKTSFAGSYVSVGTWKLSGAAGDYDVEFEDFGTGNSSPTGDTLDTWFDAGVDDPQIELADTSSAGGIRTWFGKVNVRDASTQEIVGTATLSLQAHWDS